MNQLVGEHLIDAGRTAGAAIEARDLQVRSGLGKDPQVVATAAARKFIGDRLIRVVAAARTARPQARRGPGRAGGPLVAVRLHVLTRKTLGGLETDLTGRVLRRGRVTAPGRVRGRARRPASAAAACTATGRWRARSSAAACSAAGPPGGPLAAALWPTRVRHPVSWTADPPPDPAAGRAAERCFVVADHLGHDEVEELLGELRVQLGLLGQRPEPGDLLRLAVPGRRAAARAPP